MDTTPAADTAVVYLARGADDASQSAFERFAASYEKHPAGRLHKLYVIYKGFGSKADRVRAERHFENLNGASLYLSDDSFDIGAYKAAASMLNERQVCFLNTNSELLAPDWLEKLSRALNYPEVGMVGCTGSFEAPVFPGQAYVPFPNVHLRSNAFMMDRMLFCDLMSDIVINTKSDAYQAESGSRGLTRKVMRSGLQALVVDRYGRSHSPHSWPSSMTFRRGIQDALMIGDNQTRAYIDILWESKRHLARIAWGQYIRPDLALKSSAALASAQ